MAANSSVLWPGLNPPSNARVIAGVIGFPDASDACMVEVSPFTVTVTSFPALAGSTSKELLKLPGVQVRVSQSTRDADARVKARAKKIMNAAEKRCIYKA